MPREIKHLHSALPDCLPAKNFVHGHRAAMLRTAPVQVFNLLG